MTVAAPISDAIADTRLAELEHELADLRERVAGNTRQGVAIVCFSGEWDRLYAAFTIATGALAMGQEVDMFFTFWGATALRSETKTSAAGKSCLQRMLGAMLPNGVRRAPLSRMNFGGLGRAMMGRLLHKKAVDDLPALVDEARELGARFHCCETSLNLFGWTCADLADGDQSDWCGVASFLGMAAQRQITLFV